MQRIDLEFSTDVLRDHGLMAMITDLLEIEEQPSGLVVAWAMLEGEKAQQLYELEDRLREAKHPYNLRAEDEFGGTARFYRPEASEEQNNRLVQWGVGLIDPRLLTELLAATPDRQLRSEINRLIQDTQEAEYVDPIRPGSLVVALPPEGAKPH